MSISVLILTFNEQQNIASCLESIRWSNDVVIVDSFSSDQTVEMARQNGARVLQNRFVNFAHQRNFGLSHGDFKHDWILHLDADEIVTEELRREMLAAVQRPDKEAYQVASRLIFRGRWLKHAGLYPWYQVRLGKRQSLSFVQVGHGQRESLSPNKIGTLKCPLLHYSFSKGIADWVEKHNRYSTAEARHCLEVGAGQPMGWSCLLLGSGPTQRRRALKQLFFRLPFRPMLRFLYMYFFRLGFLDGRPGLTYCRLLSMYEYFIVLKMQEFRYQQSNSPRQPTPPSAQAFELSAVQNAQQPWPNR
jgi:glycosyltransferase involved in cell wall biosynthesis